MAQNIYDILTNDHRDVENLLNQLASAGGQDRMNLLDQVALELMSHAKAEEVSFYPRIREIEDGRSESETAEQQHNMVEDLIGECYEAIDSSEEEFNEKCRMLTDTFRQHITFEEQDMFQRGRSSFDEATHQQIVDEFYRAKEHFREAMMEKARERAARRPGAQPSL